MAANRKKKRTAGKPQAVAKGGPLDIRNRVRELRTVRASALQKNPGNYRVHPLAQRDVIKGLLDEVGYVSALIARETDDGLELIDGHMRSEVTPDTEVPVLIVDLNDDEVAKVLATFDPVSAMANTNDDAYRALIEKVETQNADVRRFLVDQEEGLEDPDDVADPDEEAELREVPGMALEPHEHYDYLVVLATTSQEWNVLCDKLGLEPVPRRGSMGTSRAIRASTLLQLLVREGL